MITGISKVTFTIDFYNQDYQIFCDFLKQSKLYFENSINEGKILSSYDEKIYNILKNIIH